MRYLCGSKSVNRQYERKLLRPEAFCVLSYGVTRS